jgi:hypothetical protein
VSGDTASEAPPLRIETADGKSRDFPRLSHGDGLWRSADLEVPDGASARIVADLPAGGHWLAFSEPVEVGRESWFTHWLLRRSGIVAGFSWALFLAAWLALLGLDLNKSSSPKPGT